MGDVIKCAKCGRPLFEELVPGDVKDRSAVKCEPSCHQLTQDIARVRGFVEEHPATNIDVGSDVPGGGAC